MANPAETAPPLFVEQALVNATGYHSGRRHKEVWGSGMRYPTRLGSLAVESLRFDPDYDAGRIVDGVRDDFNASYEMDDPDAAIVVRRRSMDWLDWLSQDADLSVRSFAYIGLATMAAEHGDAETVRQVIEDPKRLWLDRHAGIPVGDPAFGQLDRLSTNSLAGTIPGIARLMAVALKGSKEQIYAVVMPTFRNVVTEFVSRDLTYKGHSIGWAAEQLIKVGTPEAQEQLDILVATMPKTPARLDLLVKLAELDGRYAAAATEAAAWHREKAGPAEQTLAGHLKPYSMARNMIDFPMNRGGSGDAVASQPIAAAIVDQIPTETDGTSAIETSVAYLNESTFGGSVHGNVLRCVRTVTGNPHFEFADPRFGFAARFENGKNSYAHGQVTVVDANLPEGRVVIDLSDEPFWSSTEYYDTRFLCRIIQAEKNRRIPVPVV